MKRGLEEKHIYILSVQNHCHFLTSISMELSFLNSAYFHYYWFDETESMEISCEFIGIKTGSLKSMV